MEQVFIMTNVPSGTYDLVVSKKCHLDYTITGLVVGTGDLDLRSSANPNIKTMTLLCGDITGDGNINSSDLSQIILQENYGKPVSDTSVNPLADLNGDGYINSSDLSIVIMQANYGKANVVYPYT